MQFSILEGWKILWTFLLNFNATYIVIEMNLLISLIKPEVMFLFDQYKIFHIRPIATRYSKYQIDLYLKILNTLQSLKKSMKSFLQLFNRFRCKNTWFRSLPFSYQQVMWKLLKCNEFAMNWFLIYVHHCLDTWFSFYYLSWSQVILLYEFILYLMVKKWNNLLPLSFWYLWNIYIYRYIRI